jgi:hypothetical protein
VKGLREGNRWLRKWDSRSSSLRFWVVAAFWGCAGESLTRGPVRKGQQKVDSAKTNVTWLGSVVFGKEVAGVVGGPLPSGQEGVEIGYGVAEGELRPA